MLTVILATLSGAFLLAFGLRIGKWFLKFIYDLAPWVILLAACIAVILTLDKHEQQGEANGTEQAQAK